MKIKIHSTNFSNGCIFENFSNFRTFTFKLSFTKQATIVINNEPINIIKAPFFIALIVLVFSSCTTSRRNSSLSFKGGLSQNKSVIVPSNFAEEKMSSDEISLGESNRLLPEKKVAIILKKNTYLAKILNPNKPLSKEPTPKKKEVNPNKFSKKKIPVTEFFFMHKFKGDEQVIMKKFFGN
ncbi:MAG: hypothetical protein NTX03_14985, partial [Bacteroidetes bacterium]|nr:hypothetical protein [Bacteroidota bacterium]